MAVNLSEGGRKAHSTQEDEWRRWTMPLILFLTLLTFLPAVWGFAMLLSLALRSVGL